jgi:hypothetical protein
MRPAIARADGSIMNHPVPVAVDALAGFLRARQVRRSQEDRAAANLTAGNAALCTFA